MYSFVVSAICANDNTQCKKMNKTIKSLVSKVRSTIVLKCPVSQQHEQLTYLWENGETAIAVGETINPNFEKLKKFTVNRTLREYNLKISNISTADGGEYCCEKKCSQYCVQLSVKGNDIIYLYSLFFYFVCLWIFWFFLGGMFYRKSRFTNSKHCKSFLNKLKTVSNFKIIKGGHLYSFVS